MNYLTKGDIDYLCDKSADNLNLVLYGMTSLMEDTEEKVELLESQTWFQRMVNTITGKNKMTVNEVSRNHDKINVYMSEAIAELYNRNCIDHDIILGLGNRLNDVFASQIELKQMFGAFAEKLNKKIISIDNFHMLVTEIEQGVYSNNANPVESICKIVSLLDERTIQDQRKLDILTRAMKEAGVVTDVEVPLTEIYSKLLYLPESEAGIIAMMFENIQSEINATIARDVLCRYYFLPERVRKMKKREAVVDNVLADNQIDPNYKISTLEFYESIVNEMIEKFAMRNDASEEAYESLVDYLDRSYQFIEYMCGINKTWSAVNGEMIYEDTKKEYSVFMNKVMDNLDSASPMGSEIEENGTNIGFFLRDILDLFPNIRISRLTVGSQDVTIDDAGRAYLYESTNQEGKSSYKFYSFGEHIENRLVNAMLEQRDYFSSESLAKKGPGPSGPTLSYYDRITVYRDYYKYVSSTLLRQIGENHADYGSVYTLVDRYPVIFDMKRYEGIFAHAFKLDKPYILLHHEGEQQLGYMSIRNKKSIAIEVEAVGVEGEYTISYKKKKDTGYVYSFPPDGAGWSDFHEKSGNFQVQWGNKVRENTWMLSIEMLVEPKCVYMVELELEIYITQLPECRTEICVDYMRR